MEIQKHMEHELYIAVNAVSGEKDRSIQTHRDSQRDTGIHTYWDLLINRWPLNEQFKVTKKKKEGHILTIKDLEGQGI